MKARRFVSVWLIVLTGFAFCQITANNWGQKLIFGPTFINTDSTELLSTALRDSVLADTLYSEVMPVSDYTEGIFTIVSHLTNLGGTTDSLKLDVRLVDEITNNSSRPPTLSIKFREWNNVFNLMAVGVNDTTIAYSTSTWYRPSTGLQFRVYDISVTTDSTQQVSTYYNR